MNSQRLVGLEDAMVSQIQWRHASVDVGLWDLLSRAYRKLFNESPPRLKAVDPGRFSLNLNSLKSNHGTRKFPSTYEVARLCVERWVEVSTESK